MIQVRRTGEGDPLEFEVIVREGKGETRHDVTMSRETCERLTAGKGTPERCLEACTRRPRHPPAVPPQRLVEPGDFGQTL